jgi:uncharacterized SAM-binding protein YcdF (DUF218 family)
MSSFISTIMPMLQPSNFIIVLLMLGVLLRATSRDSRLAGVFIKFSISALLVISLIPLHHWMYLPLENRFPTPALPAKVDGIIVLGGAINPQITHGRDQLSFNKHTERLTEGVRLARLYPKAKIVYTGGKWRPEDAVSEADAACRFFVEQGLNPARIITEGQAHNTFQNVLLSQTLVVPTPKEVWVLVTSASHIPRAVGIFRQAGWQVIPYPVDYQTQNSGPVWRFNVGFNIRMFDGAARSWLALAGYYLRGRADSFFPAP